MNEIKIGIYKTDIRAEIPTIAYEGTSACFDIKAVEDTTIPARGSAEVPNGIKLIIPLGWYIKFTDRSGNGIKKNLQIHQGIIDSGYMGDLTIKMFNMGDVDQVIEAGKGICQAEVHKIPGYELYEATDEDWREYGEWSVRKENGFGSSDKK